MALSEPQLQRVQRMARDEWESEEELWQFLETVTDAEELHLYADGFNWDTSVEELRRVIRHPLCDKGTALVIYWRGGPGWYAQYRDRAEIRSADEADGYDLSLEIEQLMLQGRFTTQRFPYDPTNDRGTDMTRRYDDVRQMRQIPREMFA